ncbi:uncharacterized protein LOC106354893 [Brassica napus]|uniref:uncharacterized protein LOC106354893 n=1 Tax=Brassica napus TaxID=3708 RepID=UPI0020790409|nr:uncharacterized protein LOC106354893 [Brassica napus]
MADQEAGWEATRKQNKQMMEMMKRMYPNEQFPNGGDDAVAETPPWNLRTKQAACNELGDEPTSIIGVNRGRNEGCSDGDSQKLKFSVSLLMEEIEKDFTAFVGKNFPQDQRRDQELFRID